MEESAHTGSLRYVCLYVCLSVCLYVCMHACVQVCMYECTHACMHVCMHACMYACMHACMYMCIHRMARRESELGERFGQAHLSPHGASCGAGACTPCSVSDACRASTSSTNTTQRPHPFHLPASSGGGDGDLATKRFMCKTLLS